MTKAGIEAAVVEKDEKGTYWPQLRYTSDQQELRKQGKLITKLLKEENRKKLRLS
jgi:hypothetical protein